ncbi:MAG: putative MerR family transcriptional regulator [Ilumatobacteraceae bacterium]|nr:putative MerR family transcriptional regulator [Ilumatobacteraceae bacterium]
MANAGLKIKEMAERSGFSAATLRYYEEIGLLPHAARTSSGYRSYDERTLERLAFIARAKQLGCTLDEIADLTTAWEGGRCGPIQDRLRSLVGDKLAATENQLVELITLSGELQRAANILETHRPDGPCDDRCGCVADPTDASPFAVTLTSKPPRTDAAPIACTLDAAAVHDRLDDWRTMLSHVAGRAEIDGGMRLELAADTPLAHLMQLVTAEQRCCQFFRFAITVDDRGVALEVTAPADALPVVTSLFGSMA